MKLIQLTERSGRLSSDIEGQPPDMVRYSCYLTALAGSCVFEFAVIGSGMFCAAVAKFDSGGGAEAANDFRERLQSMVPDMVASNWISKPCVITDTATVRPYIRHVEERVFVAAGGCRAAAKSCDEFGRLAALSIRGEQDDSYGDDAFPVVFRGEENKLAGRRQFHF